MDAQPAQDTPEFIYAHPRGHADRQTNGRSTSSRGSRSASLMVTLAPELMPSTHFFSLFHPAKVNYPWRWTAACGGTSHALFDLEEETAFSSKRTTALHGAALVCLTEKSSRRGVLSLIKKTPGRRQHPAG
jgi:hypothetical protein